MYQSMSTLASPGISGCSQVLLLAGAADAEQCRAELQLSITHGMHLAQWSHARSSTPRGSRDRAERRAEPEERVAGLVLDADVLHLADDDVVVAARVDA